MPDEDNNFGGSLAGAWQNNPEIFVSGSSNKRKLNNTLQLFYEL